MLNITGDENLKKTLGKIQPFRYRGYVYDVETGLYYLRTRYYKSVIERFINIDKFLFLNLFEINCFSYCASNPINLNDANGTATYNRTKAVEYAHNWAFARNREYYSYSDRSGDCANFVSQCLYEGGLPKTSEWNVIREKLDDIGVIEAINHNWANFFYVTRAWSSVNPLYEYLINNYSEGVIEITEGTDLEALQERYGVQVGDVMFFDADGDGIPNHATIITAVSETIGYSAHTESRRDQDIDTFFKQSPKGKAYIVLIKDEF